MSNFCHLHVHTDYSLLDGHSKIKDIVKKCKNLGMEHVAITDHGNMYGVYKFYNECKDVGIHPIVGEEFYYANDLDNIGKNSRHHLVLLAKNKQGYKNLLKLTLEASKHMYNKHGFIDRELVSTYSEGLICMSACLAGEIPQLLLKREYQKAVEVATFFKNLFGEDFYIEVQNHYLPEEKAILEAEFALAKKLGIKVVATNDSHYTEREDSVAQDILLCIQTGKKITDTQRLKFDTDEFFFKTEEEMAQLFGGNKDNCLSNTLEIAQKCNLVLEKNLPLAPAFPNLPEGETEDSYLRKLCEQNIEKKFKGSRFSKKEIRERLDYELGIISQMKFSGYFLIVWDFINVAKKKGINVGPGRGSGAGSIVCYLTDITELNPLEYDLLFERFLNPERVTMPDIDTDIPDKYRNDVVQYMIETYKETNSAQIITYGTQNPKGAVRDVARVLDLPYSLGDTISKLIPSEQHMTVEKALELSSELQKLAKENPNVKTILKYASSIEGTPRQSGTHAGGVVICKQPLVNVIPVEQQEDGLHTEFDKNEVEEIGLLKMDVLGVKTLSIIDDAKKLIKKLYNIDIDWNEVPKDDAKTMEMLRNGDTHGVFQLESTGMTELVKKLAPQDFKDMIPLVALYRPGPLGSGMVDNFIKCRHGEEEIKYLHPCLEPILKETFGVILYQEQVMKIVQVMAGFSLGRADLVRRAMGKKKEEILIAQKNDFIEGCKSNNIGEDIAGKVFDLMMYFASYGFNKSHSAAYAYLAYQTAYLKANYPLAYMASYMSNNLNNIEKINASVQICRDRNIKLLLPDVNYSEGDFIPENDCIRYGLDAIKGITAKDIEAICTEREKTPFKGIVDFLCRVPVSKANFDKLAQVGAFNSINSDFDKILKFADKLYDASTEFRKANKIKKTSNNTVSLFSEEVLENAKLPTPEDSTVFDDSETIYPTTTGQRLSMQKEILGFYATESPLNYCEETLKHCVSIKTILEHPEPYIDKPINVCGLVDKRRIIYTKKDNKQMMFVTLDMYGDKIDCVVFPKQFEEMDSMAIACDILLFQKAVLKKKDDSGLQLVASNFGKVRGKNIF